LNALDGDVRIEGRVNEEVPFGLAAAEAGYVIRSRR
jgi:hypothetical protein